jgi:hypothetical protein
MRFRGKVEALGTLRKLTGCGVKAALKEMQDRYKYFRDRYQMRLELIGNRRLLEWGRPGAAARRKSAPAGFSILTATFPTQPESLIIQEKLQPKVP